MYLETCPCGVTVSEISKQAADLASAFANKGIELTTKLDIGMEAASLFVEGAAKKKITENENVDTGLLRASINHRVVKALGRTKGQIGTSVEYGPFIELGTIKFRASPFLTPALNDNKAIVLKIISDKLKEALK